MSELRDIAQRTREKHATRPSTKPANIDQAVEQEMDNLETLSEGAKTTSDFVPDTGLSFTPDAQEFESVGGDMADISEYEEEVDPAMDDADDEDDDDVVVAGMDEMFDPDAAADEEVVENGQDSNDDSFLTDKVLRDSMPDVPEEEAVGHFESLRSEVNAQKMRMLSMGLSSEEAEAAALVKLKKLGEDINIRYLKKNPDRLIVTVDKSNVENLEFTEEEKKKMEAAKVIQLNVVETHDLEHMSVRRVPRDQKISTIFASNSGFSFYSVPLPLTGDYCRFKGSQIMQLLQTTSYQNDTPYELLNRKARLIYSQLSEGTYLTKRDSSGKMVMNYDEFLNKLMYYDVDMCLYCITAATSKEVLTTPLDCEDCENQQQEVTFNVKQILDMQDIAPEYAEMVDKILGIRADPEALKKYRDETNVTHIVRSPITNNVYHICQPSLARALEVYRIADMSQINSYLLALTMFVEKAQIYDKGNDDYIEIDADEITAMYEYLREVDDDEINILTEFITPMIVAPHFTIRWTCDKCQTDQITRIGAESLIFLKARAS